MLKQVNKICNVSYSPGSRYFTLSSYTVAADGAPEAKCDV